MEEDCTSASVITPLKKKWQPPKMWEDLTQDEKIERMREEIKKSQLSVQGRLQELTKMIDKLKEHTHSEGKVSVPITRDYYGGGMGETTKRTDEKSYF